MIQLVEIPQKELKTLKRKSNNKYLHACFILCFMSIGGSILFFSDVKFGLFACVFIIAIFLIVYLKNRQGPVRGNYKIIRQAVVTSARYVRFGATGWQLPRSFVEIDLEEEEIPESFEAIHTFTVFNSFGSGVLTYEQDPDLIGRHKDLEGRTIEIEYIAETGAVLALREAPPFVMGS